MSKKKWLPCEKGSGINAMNRYLITGFSGFVGRYFLDYLESEGDACFVKGLDIRNPDYDIGSFRNLHVDFEKNDLLSRDKVEYVIHEFQPDYILHLASYSSVSYSWKEPVESFQNNTNIYLNLIDAVRKLNLDTRILSVGSSEEYGNVGECDLPLTEDRQLMPVNPYAVARVAQEYLSQVYVEGFKSDIVLTRSFNHIGPRQKGIFVVPSLARQLIDIKRSGKRKGVVVAGDISIIRDFTDVRDVVKAYGLLFKGGRRGEVYNICSGKGLTIRDIVDMMAGELGLEIEVKIDRKLIRPAENNIIIGSNKKIKSELGWDNSIPLQQSIKEILAFWDSN